MVLLVLVSSASQAAQPPEKTAARNLTASDVLAALRGQNVQVASGVLNQPPVPVAGAFQLNVETLGRLRDEKEFENIVVKTEADGRVTRIRDIARVELGAQDYNANGYLDDRQAVPLLVFQRPGSNALATAERVLATMAELVRRAVLWVRAEETAAPETLDDQA